MECSELRLLAGAIGGDTVHVELALVSETSPDRVVPETDGVRPRSPGLVRDGVAVGVASCHYARHERQHVLNIPAAQRYALHLFLTDGRPSEALIGLQWRRLGGHYDSLSVTLPTCNVASTRVLTPTWTSTFILSKVLETCRLNLDAIQLPQ